MTDTHTIAPEVSGIGNQLVSSLTDTVEIV